MSDIPINLVQQLADSGATVGYLPAEPRQGGRGSQDAKAEKNGLRPEVQAVVDEYMNDEDRLHGDTIPETVILHERPIHRAMIYAHALGKTINEIAEQLGVTRTTVSNTLRQPWARLRLTAILKDLHKDEVEHFYKTEVGPSLEVLREIRDNKVASATARIQASNAILDRALGKPTVHVESDNRNTAVPADMARLDSELAALRKQVGEPPSGGN